MFLRLTQQFGVLAIKRLEYERGLVGFVATKAEASAHRSPTGIHPGLCENRITGKNQSSRRNGTVPATDSLLQDPDTDEEQKVDLGLGV